MNDKIHSIHNLQNLSRLVTLTFTNASWPSDTLKEKLDQSITNLESFADDSTRYTNISEQKLQRIQSLIDQFYVNQDISIFTNGGKNIFRYIIHSLSKIIVNKLPLTDTKNIDNLVILLESFPVSTYPDIAEPIMKLFLSNIQIKDNFKDIISTVFNSLPKNSQFYEENLELYTDKRYIKNRLSEEFSASALTTALVRIGVSHRYLNTPYMSSLFFSWFIHFSQYPEKLINQNISNIENCTNDEKKILFAKIIVSTFENSTIENKDIFIKQLDKVIFPTQNLDKTEVSYWQVKDEFSEFKPLLTKAHILYKAIFARFIITQFFDVLYESSADYNGRARANYWRQYSSSSSFQDIRLVMNTAQRALIDKKLQPDERKIFDAHTIYSLKNTQTEPPAFVIIFKQKVVVEFLKTGHAAQIYNPDNHIVQYLLKNKYIDSSTSLKLYTFGSVYNSDDGEGRVIHNGYSWPAYLMQFLKQNGIHKGKYE